MRSLTKIIQLSVFLLLALPGRFCPAQDLLITEFLASNDDGLRDEDGDSSDWIELHNGGLEPIDLDGWHLTDSAANLRRWRFPSVIISGGEFLVVFASGKDRADPEEPLHTDFQLDSDGEFLALVSPAGEIAYQYAPTYPEQHTDYSYGLGQSVTSFRMVTNASPALVHVPRAAGAEGLWMLPGFNDRAWDEAVSAVGFEMGADIAVGAPVVNIAPEGEAVQSSDYGNGQFPARMGIDGDLGNFTHTAAGQNLPSTWELDLGREALLGSIVLHNRRGCCTSRLRDITVFVLDEPGGEVLFESDLLNEENVLGGGGGSGPDRLEVDLVELLGGPVAGGVVRVVRTPDPDLSGTGGVGNADEADVLSLSEVEVFEVPVIGYEGLIETDLEQEMYEINSSAWLRIPFILEQEPALDLLKLRMRYDDGFIAYLNGVEVASRNAPQVAAWNARAVEDRADSRAIVFEDIVITASRELLRAGDNVLAIHGLNLSPGDEDFLISAELAGEGILDLAPRYFQSPTPGGANEADGFAGFVADTSFTVDRGFYFEPFEVEIRSETEGAVIRYTLDGSEPGPNAGSVYDGPLLIQETTTLRALALLDGLAPTNIDTHTYIFPDDIVEQDAAATIARGFPRNWGGTSADYGMDPDVIGQGGRDRFGGRYAETIRDDLLAIPTISVVMDIDEMFGSRGIYTNSGSRGRTWERRSSIELIDPDGEEEFQVNCGIRIQGGAFRSHGLTKKHSLRFLFREQYGDSKLRHPLFGDEAPDRFDTIVLRANSNDGWQWSGAGDDPLYIRDSFGRETVLAMGNVASHERFLHVYINGVYWGLYNAVERPDHAFSATYFGGEKEDWDAYSNGSTTNGNTQAWNRMLSLARQGLEDDAAYQRIQGRNPDGSDNPNLPQYVDVDNIIDYMITNLYVGNTDWPHKNYWVGFNPAQPTGFKYYMWDSEWSMGIRSDLSTNRVNVNNGVAEVYGRLRANAEFQVRFGDRLHRYFSSGGPLYVDPDNQRWDPEHPERNRPAARFMRLANTIDRAVVAESARWGDQHSGNPYTRDEHWERERDNILNNYLPRRSQTVLNQFRGARLYPTIPAPELNRRGGFIEPGFVLTMRANQGSIYYTVDGEDPRLPGGETAPQAVLGGEMNAEVLLPSEASVRVIVPSDDSLGMDWIAPDFDDSAWLSGTTGVGYERNAGFEDLINTDILELAHQINPTCYLRIEFDVENPQGLGFLTLRMKYDDGFIAYLNGERVAASNDRPDPQWNSRSLGTNSDSRAVVFENFDISESTDLLRVGRNVLAIHGLNTSDGSSDFLILPEVTAAAVDDSGVVLNEPTLIRARTLSNGQWSALEEAHFYIDTPLRITELMYHPAPPPEGSPWSEGDFEFLELANTGTETVGLAGLSIEGGVRFDFSAGAVERLAPGQVVVLVRNLQAFASRYDVGRILIAGEYDGRLANDTEPLRLVGSLGEKILDFEYSDGWIPETDGEGRSLVIIDALAERSAWNDSESWAPSPELLGSPGVHALGLPPGAGGLQRSGDANQDGRLDISDAVALLRHLFVGVPAVLPCDDGFSRDPGNIALLDHNGDSGVDLADAVALLVYLFQQGAEPAGGVDCRLISGCPETCAQ